MARTQLGALFILTVSWAHAQAPDSLAVRGKVGDQYAYALSTVITGVGAKGKIEMSMEFSEKLTKVQPNLFEWTTTFRNVRATATGDFQGAEASMNAMNNLTIVSIQNARAEVLRLRIGTQEVPSRGSSNVVLPQGKTRVGMTWTAPIETGGQIFTITYRLAGVETLAGKRVARIEGQFGRDQKARAIEPTIFWVELANGKMVRATALTEVEVQGRKVRVSYRINRK